MIDVVSYLNAGTVGGGDSTKKNGNATELGKDEFMSLLITQLTNQNPLEPMENTEFIAQLAQFSSLEQMQNIASAMELLALAQTAGTNSQMVNLIGKRVMVPGNQFTVDGEKPVNLHFKLDGDAVPAEMVIKDSSGNVVRTIELTNLETGLNDYEFDGKDESGNFLEAGNYTYEIVNSDGEPVEGLTTYANLLVDAVAFEGAAIFLKSRDITINLDDVSEVIRN